MTEEAAAPDAPKKRKRKRKKKHKQRAEASEPRRARLDADGRTRPAFLLDFPEHPELEALVAAFERGDFRTVKQEAPELRDKTEDPQVRRAAEELIERITPDPLAIYLLVAAMALLVFLVLYVYVLHGH